MAIYMKKYPGCIEGQSGLTMLEAERAFQLSPDPPVVDNLNDYIAMAIREENKNGLLFFLHSYEHRLNQRVRRFLFREGFQNKEPDRLLDYKLSCVAVMVERLQDYDPDAGASFLTFVYHEIENALIEHRMREEGGSFKSVDEYKAIRKAGWLYRETQDDTEKAIGEIRTSEQCEDKTAREYLYTAVKNRSRDDFYLRDLKDADGNPIDHDPDVSYDHSWDYVAILSDGIEAARMQRAFDKLSYRDQTLLEKRNAICMTCGRVSPLSTRLSFEELAVMFEGSSVSGAERAYRRALEKMMPSLAGHGSFHVVQLRLVSQKKQRKKIAAAIYEYCADYDGEWGEIRFDFLKNEAEITRLADGDFVKSQPFAKRAIREIQALENSKLPKKLLIPFEYENDVLPLQSRRTDALSCTAPREASNTNQIVHWV